jgi:hypothetical protein
MTDEFNSLDTSFPRAAAGAKLGRHVTTLTAWSGVPILSAGVVVDLYARGSGGSGVMIERRQSGRLVRPLRDGVSKGEYDAYLVESS